MPNHLDAASVNNIGENRDLQFQTSGDKTHQAMVPDLAHRKKAIAAAAIGVSYGTATAGATTGSTLRAAGDRVTATGVGNFTVSTIAAR